MCDKNETLNRCRKLLDTPNNKKKVAYYEDHGDGTVTITPNGSRNTGTVTLTATADDGSGKTATVKVSGITGSIQLYITASAIKPVETITIMGNAQVLSGKTLKLKAVITPAKPSVKTLVWTSSNPAATVSAKGVVTALTVLEPTTVTITATAADGSGASAIFKLTVRASVHKISIREGDTPLRGGTKITLHVDFLPIKPTNGKVIWSLRPQDTSYASVSSKGVLKGMAVTGNHTVVVTATSAENPSVSASIEVLIYPSVTAVQIFRSGSNVTGQTLTVSLTNGQSWLWLDGVCCPADVQSGVTWKSSSPKIADVDPDGFLTVLKKGTVTITCTATDGSKKSAVVKIKIQ